MEIVYLKEMPSAVEVLAAAFWNECGRHDGHTLVQVTARVIACDRRDALPLPLVAREGGAVLGTVGLRSDTVAAGPAPGPWLAALWVNTEHRGRGIGAKLIAAAERTAADLGLTELYATTSTAVRLFRRAGWTEVEEYDRAGEQLSLFHRRLAPEPGS